MCINYVINSTLTINKYIYPHLTTQDSSNDKVEQFKRKISLYFCVASHSPIIWITRENKDLCRNKYHNLTKKIIDSGMYLCTHSFYLVSLPKSWILFLDDKGDLPNCLCLWSLRWFLLKQLYHTQHEHLDWSLSVQSLVMGSRMPVVNI